MPDWTQRDVESGIDEKASAAKAQVFEQEKAKSLPMVVKESSEVKPFEPVRLQPVISPGIYESEFGTKNNDIIFHFWPPGYHDAERKQTAAPRFSKDFLPKLTKAMGDVFEPHRVSIIDDADMGALFVVAKNWGDSQFVRELSIKACEALHKACGGKPG